MISLVWPGGLVARRTASLNGGVLSPMFAELNSHCSSPLQSAPVSLVIRYLTGVAMLEVLIGPVLASFAQVCHLALWAVCENEARGDCAELPLMRLRQRHSHSAVPLARRAPPSGHHDQRANVSPNVTRLHSLTLFPDAAPFLSWFVLSVFKAMRCTATSLSLSVQAVSLLAPPPPSTPPNTM